MNANMGRKPRQLSFAELCALEDANIPFPSSDLDSYDAEEMEIKDIRHRRIERRRETFLAHLNVLWKYRETIRLNDRYRKVPIDFLYRILSKKSSLPFLRSAPGTLEKPDVPVEMRLRRNSLHRGLLRFPALRLLLGKSPVPSLRKGLFCRQLRRYAQTLAKRLVF